jgi:hypothetical protein
MNRYTSNPELNRNITLELTASRLMVIPVLITCILGLAYLTAVRFLGAPFAEIVHTFSVYGFYVSAFVLGGRQAAGALIKEVHGSTWNAQRLLSIAPQRMMIGKLFGAPIYGWYGILCFSILYCGSAAMIDHTLERLALFVGLVLSVILLHALIISLTVLKINKDRTAIISTFPFFIIGVVLAIPLVDFVNQITNFSSPYFFWYSYTLPVIPSVLAALTLFTGWSVYGLYRAMRREYLYTNSVVPWFLFTITLMIFVGGLSSADHISALTEGFLHLDQLALSAHAAFVTGVVLCYYLVFSESRSLQQVTTVMCSIAHKRWDTVLTQLPLWLVTLFLTVVAAVASVFFSMGAEDSIGDKVSALWALNMLAFVVRDSALLYWVSAQKSSRSPETKTLMYLLFLYGVIPACFMVLGLTELLPLFVPMAETLVITGTLFPWIQAVVPIVFIRNQMKKI